MTNFQSQPPALLSIRFGTPQAELSWSSGPAELNLPLPWLAGPQEEPLGRSTAALRWEGNMLLAEEEDRLIGAILVDASSRLEDPIEQAYRQLLNAIKGWHLYRIWNYVPQINEIRGGLERYRQFNIGRWAAFEQCFGKDLRSFMPAASAVGIDGDRAVLIFDAGRTPPIYFENPSQVPAYHYPADYGPRPPGFARGVRIDQSTGSTVYLSGTASIEGHRSVGEGDLVAQFKTTLHNIQIMLKRMNTAKALFPDQWAEAEIMRAHFKCYLRDSEMVTRVRQWVMEECGSSAHFTFVKADICRTDLDLEIEGVIQSIGRRSGCCDANAEALRQPPGSP